MKSVTEILLDRYDKLKWDMAETYGAATGFGNKVGKISDLHARRHKLAEEIQRVRKVIIEMGN